MRNIRKYLLIFGILFLGYLLGYLRIPYVPMRNMMAQGFILGTCLTAFFFLYGFLIRKTIISRKEANRTAKTKTAYLFQMASFLIGALTLGVILTFSFNQKWEKDRASQEKQTKLLSLSQQITQQKTRIDVLIAGIQDELNNTPDRTLRPQTVDRIIQVTQSIMPLQSEEGSNGSAMMVSEEKGFLLMQLLLMNIDSLSLTRIIQGGDFTHSKLQDARIEKCNLKGINLKGSYFEDVVISSCDMSKANMDSMILERCLVRNISLLQSSLNHSTFQFTDLMDASIVGSSCKGLKFTSGRIARCFCPKSNFRMMNLKNVEMIDINFKNSNLSGLRTNKSSLYNITLDSANFLVFKLEQTKFEDISWQHTIVTSGLDEKFNSWKSGRFKAVFQGYSIRPDSLSKGIYRLVPIVQ